MNPVLAFLRRSFMPTVALQSDLLAALEAPPGDRDFPNKVGFDEYRGRMCVLAEVSRRLRFDLNLHFRDIMRCSAGVAGLIHPSSITCTSNPELQLQTWESFCEQEGESSHPGHGCRSHADYRRLDLLLSNGFSRSERHIARWGTEVIWQSDGNHRVAAMAHFSRKNPQATYAIDVVIHDYAPNPDHPFASLNFGLVREREEATPDLFDIFKLYAELKAGIDLHALVESRMVVGEKPDPRFANTYLVVFKNESNPLSMLVQRTLRESQLLFDLRRYFGLPDRR